MANHISPTDAEIEAAIQRGREGRDTEPHAQAIAYDSATRRLVLTLPRGVTVGFEVAEVPELGVASDNDLQAIQLSPAGTTLSLRSHDIDIAVDGLLLDLLGATGWKNAIRAHLNREAARIKSAARPRTST